MCANYRRHKHAICCTRKTTPACARWKNTPVRCGGGFNHRFGLDDPS